MDVASSILLSMHDMLKHGKGLVKFTMDGNAVYVRPDSVAAVYPHTHGQHGVNENTGTVIVLTSGTLLHVKEPVNQVVSALDIDW